jgi:hypothetical protein
VPPFSPNGTVSMIPSQRCSARQADASVTIRPPILTPAQKVSHIAGERLFTHETGGLSMWGWGSTFSGAGETVARSTDTRRTRCSGDPHFSMLLVSPS